MCSYGIEIVNGNRRHHHESVRQLTAEELASKQAATGYLLRLFRDSPYSELQGARDDLGEAIEGYENAWTGVARVPQRELDRVHRQFKAWLSAVRSFDDATSHWLSQTYDEGKLSAFRSFLAAAWDNVFAYRLATQLRNANQHAARVINWITAEAWEADDGSVEKKIGLGFDCPALASKFPRINAKVRDELRDIKVPIRVDEVVAATMNACVRAYALLLLELRDDIERYATVLEVLHQEAIDHGGKAAAIWMLEDEMSDGKSSDVPLGSAQWVEVEHAWAARKALVQAEVVATFLWNDCGPATALGDRGANRARESRRRGASEASGEQT